MAFLAENNKFYHLMYLTPPLLDVGVPLEFCNGPGAEKTRRIPLPDGKKKFDDIYIHLDSLLQTDEWKW